MTSQNTENSTRKESLSVLISFGIEREKKKVFKLRDLLLAIAKGKMLSNGEITVCS